MLPSCRLCGRVPFHGDTVAKLEESILHGELKFKEVEWISVSDRGELIHVHVASQQY